MIEDGKYVAIDYTGTFEDGTVFDSNTDRGPFEFRLSSGMVIPGMDSAVKPMKVGEEKDVSISPSDGYGDYNADMLHSFPRSGMSTDFDPRVGMAITVQTQDGSQIPAMIKEVSDTSIVFDLNHPLAGKILNFRIRLLEINDEAKYSHDSCGCDCSSDCGDGGCSDHGSGCC